MVGVSNRALEAQYGELSGSVASQWGEDAMATIDDKLHLSEQTAVQTVQGPVNFSKSGSTYTFASLGDFNAGITVTGGTATFDTLVDMNAGLTVANTATFASTIVTPNSNNLSSLVTAEVSQLLNIGAVTISATQWGYVGDMDQPVKAGSNVVFGTFKIKSGTAYDGHFDHAITAARTWTLPNISGTVAMWNVDNAIKTRYFTVLIPSATEGSVTFGAGYAWNDLASGQDSIYDIHIPDGAIVTDMYIVTSSGGGTTDMDVLLRSYTSPSLGWDTLMTATMSNIGNPTVETALAVTDFTIDGSIFYYIYIENCNGPVDILGFRVKYTQTQP